MLASTGEAFDRVVLDETIELAQDPRCFVHVMSIARIWGTSLGIQHPGLFPSKREWQHQLEIVGGAVRTLKKAGLEARGGVIASRNPSKVITREAKRLGCRGIVIGARPVSWWMGLMLQDEAWWVQRRSAVPVVAVPYEPHP
ncbi:MAG: universal stress protein [Candidatus Dormibacterales bacterium]